MRFYAVAAALFAIARSAQCTNNGGQVYTNIQSINNYTIMLNNDVQRFTNVSSGIPYGLQVQEDSVNLHKQIVSAISLTNSSDNFGEPSSTQIAGAVAALLGTTRDTLGNVTSKAKDFGFLGPLVLASLYQLKLDTDQFGAAVQQHLDTNLANAAPLIIAQFDDEFNKAITAYGGKGMPHKVINREVTCADFQITVANSTAS